MEETYTNTDRAYLNMDKVAAFLNISRKTVENWYKWKEENPDHELAKLLPEPTRIGRLKFWKMSDLYEMANFMANRPRGRNGVMASVTQRYYKKEKKDGKTRNTD